MEILTAKILSDESGCPVEVRMDYDEFLRVKEVVQDAEVRSAYERMMSVAGTVDWGEDGLEYQRRLRAEWD